MCAMKRPHVQISMPRGGEAGVMVFTLHRPGARPLTTEVRGRPYSTWRAEDEMDPLVQVHSRLHHLLVTPLHADEEFTTLTPDHPAQGRDFDWVRAMIEAE